MSSANVVQKVCPSCGGHFKNGWWSIKHQRWYSSEYCLREAGDRPQMEYPPEVWQRGHLEPVRD